MKSTRSHSLKRIPALLSITFVLVASASAAQQDVASFFHKGAQHFLATNEMAQAKLAVTNGLNLYPNDEKLRKLWELLNQQQQQNKDDQSQKEEKKDQQSKDQQKQGEDKEEQQKKSEERKKQEQQKQEQDQASKQDKEKGDEKKSQQASPQQDKGDPQEEGEAQPQGTKAVRMTPQQAIQLLEALKGEEKVMPFLPVLKTNRQDRIFKDW